ncbi:DUF1360 domain-containing protein [Bacillus sp. HMF5848]|uniref:DUF1360 domain-containing protein n=1 Tax=Bacillus sp. HMF5848 TaxID=2495421 RepID=UPI00163ABB47|nr:DUF1360 domain-containing protein [Bacillus sp. HMF5848]
MTQITWLQYLMVILASYRLTHLIVFDKITEKIRDPFMKLTTFHTPEGDKRKKIPKNLFGYLLNCYWCTGVWSAIFLGGGFILFHDVFKLIIFILSIAGAQAVIETFVGVNIKKVDYYNKQK